MATPSRLGLSPLKRAFTWVLPVINENQDTPGDIILNESPMKPFDDPDTCPADHLDEDEATMRQYLSDDSDDDDDKAYPTVNNLTWTVPVSFLARTLVLR